MTILIASSSDPLATELHRGTEIRRSFNADAFCSSASHLGGASYVYIPASADDEAMTPDLAEASRVLRRVAQERGTQFVLLSSALCYGTGAGRPGFVGESYSARGIASERICDQWMALESLAASSLADRMPLTILRPCPIVGSTAFPACLLSQSVALTLPGHDPVFQFLSPDDLVRAVLCVLERRVEGVFNVAPDTVITMQRALRLTKGMRLSVPRTLQRVVRRKESLEYLRYSWTISGEAMKRDLGFSPLHSSLGALQHSNDGNPVDDKLSEFDPFGMDKQYIRFYGRTLFRFLSDVYWRIEDQGTENIPDRGPAILAGMHRGFMPWDGVMALHTIAKRTGRYPRFLTHPGLLKFPFLANFMTKLGGVVACQESADAVLESKELLGIFPEGIRGAFTFYRDAYKLKAFARNAFVKFALRHQVSIIPFVTVGSAEIFPIFAKINSPRWTRYTDWPCIPITATFPLLPVPLPSKWHIQFLPPIKTEYYPPEAAENPAIVKDISRQVRMAMQQAVDDLLLRRRSVFFGSLFERRSDESQSKPVPV